MAPDDATVEAFIERWSKSGASERANYQLFLSELCTVLGVPLPNPSVADDHENAYVFERRVPFEVRMQNSKCQNKSSAVDSIRNSTFDTRTSHGFIDLYRRGAFVLETKQGVERKDREALSEAGREREARQRKGHGFRGTIGFDQAERNFEGRISTVEWELAERGIWNGLIPQRKRNAPCTLEIRPSHFVIPHVL